MQKLIQVSVLPENLIRGGYLSKQLSISWFYLTKLIVILTEYGAVEQKT